MEDAVVGDNAEPGGTRLTASFEDWPDDFEAEVAPRRQPAADHQGAGSSIAQAAKVARFCKAVKQPQAVSA